MKRRLATYSLETDSIVLLTFDDGSQVRCALGELAHYLAAPDVARIEGAVRLRQSFIKTHMPRTKVLLLAATGTAAAAFTMATAPSSVAALLGPTTTERVEATHEGIARNLALPAASPNGVPGTDQANAPQASTPTIRPTATVTPRPSASPKGGTAAKTTKVTLPSVSTVLPATPTVPFVPLATSTPVPTPTPEAPVATPSPETSQPVPDSESAVTIPPDSSLD